MNGDRGPLVSGAMLALALALILAAHGVNRQPGWSLFAVYIYWFCRMGMTYLLIVGIYAALTQAMTERSSPFVRLGLAVCLSFPPFVMAVTMLDVAIGGVALLDAGPDMLIGRLAIEAASLIDNHLTTSAFLLAPYLRSAVLKKTQPPAHAASPSDDAPVAARAPAAADPAEEAAEEPTPTPQPQATPEPETEPEPEAPGLLLAAQPRVRGELLAAEAQEHYVKLKATEQGGMALYRFGDAVRELGRYQGMQIHRSHWVADSAVVALIGKRGALKLELVTGEIAPVSRRYELEVEARYGDRERRSD
ncbi:LytTR family DNA-binding domain-containing protein [Pikeienuella sp. HZG-20]|uniref:LytTR family DNA-binding domain-containing protein n=1 Tax=Paludibacillus litoralis TaxID=3133267 RepID=UPI0030EEF9F6